MSKKQENEKMINSFSVCTRTHLFLIRIDTNNKTQLETY